MPKFFFGVKNGITIQDPTGSWCWNEAEARSKAIVTAEAVEKVEERVPAPARGQPAETRAADDRTST